MTLLLEERDETVFVVGFGASEDLETFDHVENFVIGHFSELRTFKSNADRWIVDVTVFRNLLRCQHVVTSYHAHRNARTLISQHSTQARTNYKHTKHTHKEREREDT